MSNGANGFPDVLGGGSRDLPPHARPASISDRREAAFGGRVAVQRKTKIWPNLNWRF